MFKDLFENRPVLNSRQDVMNFISDMYEKDVPRYEDYMYIINSLKRRPALMNPSNMKYQKGKYDAVIGIEKGPLKRKFLFEIEDGFLNIYKQEKKGQRVKDFKPYKEYNLDELL